LHRSIFKLQYILFAGLISVGAHQYNEKKLSEIRKLDREIIKKASDIYVGLKEKGELIGDADILIAASCLLKNMVLVTDDEEHFRRIKELEVENWLLRL
jgi:predicted nucleic acid-binding protein